MAAIPIRADVETAVRYKIKQVVQTAEDRRCGRKFERIVSDRVMEMCKENDFQSMHKLIEAFAIVLNECPQLLIDNPKEN